MSNQPTPARTGATRSRLALGAKFGLLEEHRAHARLGEYGYKHVRTLGRHSVYEHPKHGLAVVDNRTGHVHTHHESDGHMEYTANEVKEGWRKS